MPNKTYVLTEVIFTDSGAPISRLLRSAGTTDELKDLADEANDLYETAVIDDVKAKHAAAQEAFPTAIIEAKPNADAHRERGAALFREGTASGARRLSPGMDRFARAAKDVTDAN